MREPFYLGEAPPAEHCHFHPDRQAVKWRKEAILGEGRVPLCAECCVDIRKSGLWSLYPLNEIHIPSYGRLL